MQSVFFSIHVSMLIGVSCIPLYKMVVNWLPNFKKATVSKPTLKGSLEPKKRNMTDAIISEFQRARYYLTIIRRRRSEYCRIIR